MIVTYILVTKFIEFIRRKNTLLPLLIKNKIEYLNVRELLMIFEY